MDLKIKDVAELLNVSETTIRRWLAEGKIPAYRLHHQYRFSKAEIQDWMLSCRLQNETGNFLPSEEEQIFPPKEEKGMQQFSLFRAIHQGAVLTDIQATEKEALIRETMARVSEKLETDPLVISDLLLDRERLMPTGLSNGIAVPHTRDFILEGPKDVVVVVFPKEPIDWGALDEKPIHTLFFLFACSDKRHLHLLAKLAHLSSHDEALELFHSKPDKKELLEYIRDWESRVGTK